MEAFDIQAWHVALFFVTILVGIFKNEIINVFDSVECVRERKYNRSQKFELLSPAGIWEDAIVVSYNYTIPFKQAGGITIQQKDSDGNVYEEKFSFPVWKTLRTRRIDTAAVQANVSERK